MKKIGLVTFYRNNYGSALQCYSLKKTIESFGYECVLIDLRYHGIKRLVHGVVQRASLFIYFLFHRRAKRDHDEFIKGMIATNKCVNNDSIGKIDGFIKTELKPQPFTYHQLKRVSKTDEFAYFITGSDQVWNCSKGYVNNYYFLKFCPNNKKVCFAPSLGNPAIKDYIKKTLSKALNAFSYLSCREESGAKSINELIGSERCVALDDPVFLLSEKDYSYLSSKANIRFEGEYVFIHFLNHPSEVACEFIRKVFQKYSGDYIFVFFGNDYGDIRRRVNGLFVSGSPYDYVYLIQNSRCVITDSFHSTAVSISVSSKFYVFDREYGHSASQFSRIENLLEKFSCFQQYIKEVPDKVSLDETKKPLDHSVTRREIRNKQMQYLISAIGNNDERK